MESLRDYSAELAARNIVLDPMIESGNNNAFQNITIGDLSANGGTVIGFYRKGENTIEVAYDESKEGKADAITETTYSNR